MRIKRYAPPRCALHRVKFNKAFAGMAELADAYGSGPYESNFMQVQVLLPAPKNTINVFALVVFFLQRT